MEASAEDTTKDSLINPYYAVSFADYLFKPHGTAVAKEDWVLANTKLIKESASEGWLKRLLTNLTAESSDNLTHMVMNPRQAVAFSDSLRGEHQPIVSEDEWVAANVKLMKELGTEAWLWRLLEVLETGGPTDIRA